MKIVEVTQDHVVIVAETPSEAHDVIEKQLNGEPTSAQHLAAMAATHRGEPHVFIIPVARSTKRDGGGWARGTARVPYMLPYQQQLWTRTGWQLPAGTRIDCLIGIDFGMITVDAAWDGHMLVVDGICDLPGPRYSYNTIEDSIHRWMKFELMWEHQSPQLRDSDLWDWLWDHWREHGATPEQRSCTKPAGIGNYDYNSYTGIYLPSGGKITWEQFRKMAAR
jgi:hypothetical protein